MVHPYRPDPPPEEAKLAAFVFREVVALLFIVFWLFLFAVQLFTAKFELPFWFHCVAIGTLAYALGLNVAELTSFRAPKEPLSVMVVPHTPEKGP